MNCYDCEYHECKPGAMARHTCDITGAEVARDSLDEPGLHCPLSLTVHPDGYMSVATRAACGSILWLAAGRDNLEIVLAHYSLAAQARLLAELERVRKQHRVRKTQKRKKY